MEARKSFKPVKMWSRSEYGEDARQLERQWQKDMFEKNIEIISHEVACTKYRTTVIILYKEIGDE